MIAQADPMSLQQLLALIPSLSGSVVLVLVCYGFYTGKIIRRTELDKTEARAEKAETMVLRLLTNSERATGAAERLATMAEKAVDTPNRSGQ